MPPLTYHLVPRGEWLDSDPARPYVPLAFGADGFVHCTDGADEVAATANRYYSAVADELLVLTLDLARVEAPVKYEDPGRIYPHIYGPVPRAAIVHVQPMVRDANGRFVAPAPR